MNKVTILILIFVMIFISGCFKEEWEGFVYPNKNNLAVHKNIGTFSSLEQCRSSALSTLSSLNGVNKGDYECGLNYGTRTGMGPIKICEKTVR